MESQQQIIAAGNSLPAPSPFAAPIEVELVHLFDKMKAVRAFIFDVDGVLTDNTLLVTESGEYLRTMNVLDGQALRWANDAGYPVGIITGGTSEGVKKRMAQLGVEEYYSGIKDKALAFSAFVQRTGILPTEICYMGDDLPDLPVLRKVVLSCCPHDARPEVLALCDYISPLAGGAGCVRDLLEKIMKLQGKWPAY
jgi:3-deoxy-D-manno-octulosonate 8-phosphate phosphatase (KDO 8-P phosphatase)